MAEFLSSLIQLKLNKGKLLHYGDTDTRLEYVQKPWQKLIPVDYARSK